MLVDFSYKSFLSLHSKNLAIDGLKRGLYFYGVKKITDCFSPLALNRFNSLIILYYLNLDMSIKFYLNLETYMLDYDLMVKIINELCQKNNISQNKMLNDCGAGTRTIQNILSGSSPSVDKIYKIADYFDVSVDYLLGRTDNPDSHKK